MQLNLWDDPDSLPASVLPPPCQVPEHRRAERRATPPTPRTPDTIWIDSPTTPELQ